MRMLLSRLFDLVWRRSREDRLDEEVRAHLDLLTDEFMAKGLARHDALLAARRAFGNLDRTRMAHRDQRGFSWIETLLQDGRFAMRVLARERGFAMTAIAVLGIGIGVNNMFFTVVYAHKFRGLPIARPDRLLSISLVDDRGQDRALSPGEFESMARDQSVFAALVAHVPGVVTVGDEGRAADRYDASFVSSNAMAALGIAPILGRLPSASEDNVGAAPVVVLGESVWANRYRSDPGILGRSVLVNGEPVTVIGIVPDQAGFPSTALLWLPLGQSPGRTNRDARSWRVFGRLVDTATVSDARLQIETLFDRINASAPAVNRVRARVIPLNERLLGDLSGWGPFVLAGIVIVLVACANAGNLMMARATQRAQEVAIRASLGASRARIIRQLLVEATVIAAAGGALGGVFSIAGVRLVESAIPEGMLPYWSDYRMDAGVFTALVLISFLTVIVFGIVPAVHASRTDVNRTLKDGGRGSTGQSRLRIWTAAFLTAELALAMIMLNQIAIPGATNTRAMPTDLLIHTTDIATAAVTLPASAYATPEQRAGFFRRLHERLAARPEVVAASRATLLPGEGGNISRRLAIDGGDEQDVPEFVAIEIAPAYFQTLQVPLIKGDEFSAADASPGRERAIVNERFVSVILRDQDPIGKRIALPVSRNPQSGPPRWLTITGVAQVIRQQGGGGVDQQAPAVYLPIDINSPATSMLMVRHQVDAATIAAALRAEVTAVDQNVALYRMRTLARAVDDAQWNRRVSAYLATIVCLLSVLLAMVGLYAVTAQRVALKTQEIGVRMAMGARTVQIVALVLRGLRFPLVLGLIFGALGSSAWERTFAAEGSDAWSAPRIFITVSALIVLFVIASCFVPLRRATRLDPVAALRQE